jgi:hypothetical protein
MSQTPPTSNYLDSCQRNRLLRSTRKLEALLGTTPYLVEPDISPPSPATRAYRREGRIFGRHSSPSTSPSSSRSSSLVKPSQEFDQSYVLVNGTPSLDNLLLPRDLDLDQSGGAPLSGKKRRCKKKRNAKATNGKNGPRGTSGKANDGASAKNKGLSPSPLPYPLVLSLRSVPKSLADPRLMHQQTSSFPSLSLCVGVPILNIPPTPTTPTPSTPLSPLSPTNYTYSNVSEQEREHDQRRKKFAKLTRTLGENVPPELVFHTQEPNTNADTNDSSAGLIHTHSKCSRPRSPTLPRIATANLRSRSTSPSPFLLAASGGSASVSPDFIIPRPPATPAAQLPPALDFPKQVYPEVCTVTTPSRTYRHRPRSLSLDMGNGAWRRDRQSGNEKESRSAGGVSVQVIAIEQGEEKVPPTIQVRCPPSFETLFDPLESDMNEPLLASYNRLRKSHYQRHRHTHSSPPTSPVGMHVNTRTSSSDSHGAQTRTPTPTPSLASKLPSLLHRKFSKSKPSPGAGVGPGKKSHTVKSQSIGLVEEVSGSSRVTENSHSSPSAGDNPHPSPPIPRSGAPHTLECGRRKEREWSGEWNRGDMAEVVRALRELKAC